jgi:hypothetical protein
MFKHILVGTMVILVGTVISANAEPKDDVKDAFKKLSDGGNYSWTATVEAQFGASTTKGKTDKTDGTFYTVTRGDNSNDFAALNGKGAIKGDDGWQSAEDAAANGQGMARFMAAQLRNYKAPADAALTTLDKIDNFTKTDDVYSADMTPDQVKAVMATFGRRRGGNGGNGATPPEITDPKGSVKVWIKDGAVSKMVLTIGGSMSLNGNDVQIDRTTTTEFSDVGSTKVEIPDDAKKVLTAAPTTAPAAAPMQ